MRAFRWPTQDGLSRCPGSPNPTETCSRLSLLTAMALATLVGCAGDWPSDSYPYQGSFYEDDWIYYYETTASISMTG